MLGWTFVPGKGIRMVGLRSHKSLLGTTHGYLYEQKYSLDEMMAAGKEVAEKM